MIAAAGVPGLVTADMVKPGAAVLDVGVSRTADGLRGDVAGDVAEVAGFLSPNPGGVGPLTRAFLLTNVVERAEHARSVSRLSMADWGQFAKKNLPMLAVLVVIVVAVVFVLADRWRRGAFVFGVATLLAAVFRLCCRRSASDCSRCAASLSTWVRWWPSGAQSCGWPCRSTRSEPTSGPSGCRPARGSAPRAGQLHRLGEQFRDGGGLGEEPVVAVP